MTVIIAGIADTHPNSSVGLCPPGQVRQTTEGPSPVILSRAQEALWEAYCSYWRDIAALKKKHGATVICVLNGDGVDDPEMARYGRISESSADAVIYAEACMKPAVEVAEQIFIVKGSRFHVGYAGSSEDLLARVIGAVPAPGSPAWWSLRLEVEGVRFLFEHHPPGRASMPWTLPQLPARLSKILYDWHAEEGVAPPDVAVFSHLHTLGDSGQVSRPRVVLTPGWQMRSEFLFKLGAASRFTPVGGIFFIVDSGSYEFGWRRYHWRRDNWVSINSEQPKTTSSSNTGRHLDMDRRSGATG